MENNILISYTSGIESQPIDVLIEDDTVWLTQLQMVQLFQSTKQNISLHISNIFKEGELEENLTVKKYLTVQNEGELFDAHVLISKIIKSANQSIFLFDNYIDETVLTQLSKKNKGVTVKIFIKNISRQLQLDVEKFNKQYGSLQVIEFDKSHDRFLIIVQTAIYHLGASLKDLGKKWFAFSKLNIDPALILGKLDS